MNEEEKWEQVRELLSGVLNGLETKNTVDDNTFSMETILGTVVVTLPE